MYKVAILLFLVSFPSFSQQSDVGHLDVEKPIKTYSKDGVTVKSYDFKSFEPFLKKEDNTTYVINFWATWCLPCIKELPYFEQLNEKYKDQNVKVILVSLDLPKKVETNLIPFLLKKKILSEVIHLNDPNANAWIEKVNKDWSGAIPATIVYNSKERKFYEKSFTFDELEKELLTLKK